MADSFLPLFDLGGTVMLAAVLLYALREVYNAMRNGDLIGRQQYDERVSTMLAREDRLQAIADRQQTELHRQSKAIEDMVEVLDQVLGLVGGGKERGT